MKAQFFHEDGEWCVWISTHEDNDPIDRADACSICIACEDTKAKAYSAAMNDLIAGYTSVAKGGVA